MAKLATQNIVIQLSKAVKNDADEEITVLDEEAIKQLTEAAEALAGDENVVVEVTHA